MTTSSSGTYGPQTLIASLASVVEYENDRFWAFDDVRCGLTLVLSPVLRLYQPAKSDVSTRRAPSSAIAPAGLRTATAYSAAISFPDMATATQLARTRDGLALKAHRWPAQGTPRAHLLLVHGIAEHAGRHAHVAARFARSGIETHAYDLRGFGGSGGTRAYIDAWPQYHDDVEDELGAVRAGAGGLPVILMGHSMGGLIAVSYVLTERPKPDALVLSAPAIGAAVPAWKRLAAAFLSRAMPKFVIKNDFQGEGLSHDPAVGVAYLADPLAVHRTTARLGQELLAEQVVVQRQLAALDRMPIPTYVLHGAADPIVPASASGLLEGKGNVTRRVYPDLVHEMHNEPQSDQVIADTVRWIEGWLDRR